jgi:hypothetical protein
MRFLLPNPLGNDKHSMMFHSSGFAIAAGVVAVGSAAASGAMAMSAADKAAKAQGKAGSAYTKQLKAATNQFIEQQSQVKEAIANIDPNLDIPDFSLLGTADVFAKDKKGRIKKDKKGNPIIAKKGSPSATLEAITAANQITANTLQQIDRIVPGSAEARGQVMQSIGQWENNLNQQYQGLQANQGLIDQQRQAVSNLIANRTTPQQDQEFNRKLAEGLGGSFNMQTAGLGLGGFQTAQATYADQLMQSGERRMLAGLQLAPGVNEQQRGLAASSIGLSEGFRGLQNTMGTWMSLANSWNQNVPQVIGLGLQGRGQNIQVQQYGIQNAFEQQGLLSQINQGNYGAMTGQAQGIYGVNKDTAAANYANTMAGSKMIGDTGGALAGAFGGISNAYGQLATAQGAGAGTSGLNTATGFYGTGAQAAKAYGVPVSQIQYYQPTKGAGGYYYNA